MPTHMQSDRSQRRFLRILIFLGAVLTGVMLASVVLAGWTTIDVGNSTIDTATWGTADYSDAANNDPGITDRDEIKNAWVRYDGTNIYFRIETLAAEALSAANMRAVGGIDCNDDGDFSDPFISGPDGDRLIVFARSGAGTGTVDIYDGALGFVGAVAGDNSDSPATECEYRVAGSAGSVISGLPRKHEPDQNRLEHRTG